MYKKSKSLYLLAMAAVGISMLFASCGDNVVETAGGTAQATLNIVVRDGATGNVLQGATVTLLTDGNRTVTSSAKGYATFDNVSVGNHKVLVEVLSPIGGVNYAARTADVAVARHSPVDQDPFFVAGETTSDVSIAPLTATSLSGTVQYRDDNGELKVAAGATVRITFGDNNLIERFRDAVVATDGTFTFSNLPAGANYTLEALDFTVGTAPNTTVTYPRTTLFSGQALIAGKASVLTQAQVYDPKLTTFRYTGSINPQTVAENGTITLTFSEPIDPAKTISPFNFSHVQAADVKIGTGAAANTITLTPLENWNSNFSISNNSPIISTNGNTIAAYTLNLSFILDQEILTAPVEAWIDTTRLSFNIPSWTSTHVPLAWKTVVGATSYEIFRKDHKENTYTRIANLSASSVQDIDNDSICHYQVPIASSAIQNRTYAYVIRAVNSRSQSPLESAVPVVVASRPTLSSAHHSPVTISAVDTAVNVASSSGSAATIVSSLNAGTANSFAFEHRVYFTEKMDVITPTVSIRYTGAANAATYPQLNRMKIVPTWETTDRESILITFQIEAATELMGLPPPGMPVNFVVRVSGLKSAAGQPFFYQHDIPGSDIDAGVGRVTRDAFEYRIALQF